MLLKPKGPTKVILQHLQAVSPAAFNGREHACSAQARMLTQPPRPCNGPAAKGSAADSGVKRAAPKA